MVESLCAFLIYMNTEHWENRSLCFLTEVVDDILYIEKWEYIIDYEGLYQVSSFGRIKSFHGKSIKIMKLCEDKQGYLTVGLSKNADPKIFKVHRLVGIMFIPPIEGKPDINHKKGNKKDNRVISLEWHNDEDNINHAWQLYISWDKILTK